MAVLGAQTDSGRVRRLPERGSGDGGLLGASWGPIGASWGPLGGLLGPLGGLLGASWGLLGASPGKELDMAVRVLRLGPLLEPCSSVWQAPSPTLLVMLMPMSVLGFVATANGAAGVARAASRPV